MLYHYYNGGYKSIAYNKDNSAPKFIETDGTFEFIGDINSSATSVLFQIYSNLNKQVGVANFPVGKTISFKNVMIWLE